MRKKCFISLLMLMCILGACKAESEETTVNDSSAKEETVKEDSSVALAKTDVKEGNQPILEDCNEETITYESIVDVLPDKENVPDEICSLFYDNEPFEYVYYVYEDEYLEGTPVRESIETRVSDFTYEAYAIKAEDGSKELPLYDIHWQKYALIDLDHDGTDEVVYYVYQGGDGYYIVFHVSDGKVHGYSELYRNYGTLYNNGVIEGEAGADWYWLERIVSFDKGGFETEKLATKEGDVCYVEGNETSTEEFDKYFSSLLDNGQAMEVEWVTAE